MSLQSVKDYVVGIPARTRFRVGHHFSQVDGFDSDFGRTAGHARYSHANGNCYAYALGVAMSRWPRPGQLTKIWQVDMTQEELTPRNIDRLLTLEDGLVRIREHSVDPKKWQVLAAVVPTEIGNIGRGDSHFYRLHPENGWSHKCGGYAPRYLDDSDVVIDDLNRADRGCYDTIVGYYTVPEEGISYRY